MKPHGSILVVALLLLGAWSTPAAAQGVLLVADKAGDTLLFVDARTLEVVDSAATGSAPHEVVVAPDGSRAFVANYAGSTLSVIDVAAPEELRRIDLAPYTRPHGLAITSDGEALYVTAEADRAVIEDQVRNLV